MKRKAISLILVLILTNFIAMSAFGVDTALDKQSLKLYFALDATVTAGNVFQRECRLIDPLARKWKATIDYGDGLGEINLGINEDLTFKLNHLYVGVKETYQVKAKFIASDGQSINGEFTVKIKKLTPLIEVGSDVIINRGALLKRVIKIKNYGYSNWKIEVNQGDGSKPIYPELNADGTINLDLIYMHNGVYTVTIKISNQEGLKNSASLKVKVKDYIIQAESVEDIMIKQGESIRKKVDIKGPIEKISKIIIDYGDGSEPQMISPNKSLELIKTYYKAGNHKVSINVIDLDGDSYISSFLAKVENVAPVVYTGPYLSTQNGHITKFCYFTDPGDDNCQINVSFGDNTPTKYNYPHNGNHFTLEHTYNTIGVYYISIWVHDGNGGTGSSQIRVKFNVD